MTWFARALGVAGLSAAAAVAAHGGPAALAGGRPLLAALVGSLIALAGMGAILGSAAARRAQAMRIQRGDVLSATLDASPAVATSTLVAVMLVCQAGAHVTLLLLGVRAHAGPPAPIALHAALALVGAGLLVAVERLLAGATRGLGAAIAAAAALLADRPAAPSPRPVPTPRPFRVEHAHRGRAPPLADGLGS
jgi:hypothetical protein